MKMKTLLPMLLLLLLLLLLLYFALPTKFTVRVDNPPLCLLQNRYTERTHQSAKAGMAVRLQTAMATVTSGVRIVRRDPNPIERKHVSRTLWHSIILQH